MKRHNQRINTKVQYHIYRSFRRRAKNGEKEIIKEIVQENLEQVPKALNKIQIIVKFEYTRDKETIIKKIPEENTKIRMVFGFLTNTNGHQKSKEQCFQNLEEK